MLGAHEEGRRRVWRVSTMKKVEVLRLRLVDERGFDEKDVVVQAVPWTSFLQRRLRLQVNLERDEAVSAHERDVRGEARGAFVVAAGRARRSRPISTRNIHAAAAASPRFVGDISMSQPRRRRNPSPWTIRVAAAASPRPTPRTIHVRSRGAAAIRRRDISNVGAAASPRFVGDISSVGAAASPRFVGETYPRGERTRRRKAPPA